MLVTGQRLSLLLEMQSGASLPVASTGANELVPIDRSVDRFMAVVSEWFSRDFPIVLIREIAQYFVVRGMSAYSVR